VAWAGLLRRRLLQLDASRSTLMPHAAVPQCPACAAALRMQAFYQPLAVWLETALTLLTHLRLPRPVSPARAVPYRPGGSMYARNPPFDPSVHIHLDFGREGH